MEILLVLVGIIVLAILNEWLREKEREEYREEYHDYIKNSPKWQEKRKRKLEEANYQCAKCGAINTRLDVHHLHYDNAFNEEFSDLQVLCRECHRRIHGH